MKHRLIILDFDGTMADTRATIVRTLQMTMSKRGLPVLDEATCASTIGLPLEECFLAMYPGMTGPEADRCAQTYREIFIENKKSLLPELFPGVKETLQTLVEQGHSLAIASSRHRKSIVEFLDGFGIRSLIPYVLGAGDVEKAKPDPEPVLRCLSDLGCKASETLVVGDMPYDILMGRRAGAETCGVTYGNSNREDLLASGADHVVDSFSELLDIEND